MPRAVVFFLSFRLCVPLLSSLLFSWLAGGWIFISHFTFRRFLIKIATNTHWKRNEEVFMAHAIASYINVRVLIDRWRAISLYFTLTVTIAYTIQNTNIHYFVSRYPGYGACVRACDERFVFFCLSASKVISCLISLSLSLFFVILFHVPWYRSLCTPLFLRLTMTMTASTTSTPELTAMVQIQLHIYTNETTTPRGNYRLKSLLLLL